MGRTQPSFTLIHRGQHCRERVDTAGRVSSSPGATHLNRCDGHGLHITVNQASQMNIAPALPTYASVKKWWLT